MFSSVYRGKIKLAVLQKSEGSSVGSELRVVTIIVIGKDGKETEKKMLKEVKVLTFRTKEYNGGKVLFRWGAEGAAQGTSRCRE